MKAVRFHGFGGPEVLHYEEVEQPTPGAGEVRIRVAATSFHPLDVAIRTGSLQGSTPVRLPYTPGVEVVGTIDALGAGVARRLSSRNGDINRDDDGGENDGENDGDVGWDDDEDEEEGYGVAVGDRVVGFLPQTSAGAAAEFVIAPVEVLTGVPGNSPWRDGSPWWAAAALPLVGLTAWQALFDHGGLTAGQRVLVHGADGAVGGYAVQLARQAGAHVIATVNQRIDPRIDPRADPRHGAHTNASSWTGWTGWAGADEVIELDDSKSHAEVWDIAHLRRAVSAPVDLLINLTACTPMKPGGLVSLVGDGGKLVDATAKASATPCPSDARRGVVGIDLSVRNDTDELADLVARVGTGELILDVARRVNLADLPTLHRQVATGGEPPQTVLVLVATNPIDQTCHRSWRRS